MKLKGKIIKISLVLFVLGGIAIASVLWQGKSPDGKGLSDLGILLTKPAFAQEAGVSFLEQEAGISAWMNAGKSIDLTRAKTVFKTIEKDTNEYVVGSIPLSGYSEREDVHAFVHKDGWIVVYYMKKDPAAKIVDWNNFGDNKIKGTKLENGIVAVCTKASVSVKDIKYYDFRNPDANKMMMIIAIGGIGRDKTFKVKMPSAFVFYESSYSYYGQTSANYGIYANELKLDGKSLVEGDAGYVYGLFSSNQLTLDTFHIIKNNYPCAVVFVYKES